MTYAHYATFSPALDTSRYVGPGFHIRFVSSLSIHFALKAADRGYRMEDTGTYSYGWRWSTEGWIDLH